MEFQRWIPNYVILYPASTIGRGLTAHRLDDPKLRQLIQREHGGGDVRFQGFRELCKINDVRICLQDGQPAANLTFADLSDENHDKGTLQTLNLLIDIGDIMGDLPSHRGGRRDPLEGLVVFSRNKSKNMRAIHNFMTSITGSHDGLPSLDQIEFSNIWVVLRRARDIIGLAGSLPRAWLNVSLINGGQLSASYLRGLGASVGDGLDWDLALDLQVRHMMSAGRVDPNREFLFTRQAPVGELLTQGQYPADRILPTDGLWSWMTKFLDRPTVGLMFSLYVAMSFAIPIVRYGFQCHGDEVVPQSTDQSHWMCRNLKSVATDCRWIVFTIRAGLMNLLRGVGPLTGFRPVWSRRSVSRFTAMRTRPAAVGILLAVLAFQLGASLYAVLLPMDLLRNFIVRPMVWIDSLTDFRRLTDEYGLRLLSVVDFHEWDLGSKYYRGSNIVLDTGEMGCDLLTLYDRWWDDRNYHCADGSRDRSSIMYGNIARRGSPLRSALVDAHLRIAESGIRSTYWEGERIVRIFADRGTGRRPIRRLGHTISEREPTLSLWLLTYVGIHLAVIQGVALGWRLGTVVMEMIRRRVCNAIDWMIRQWDNRRSRAINPVSERVE